MLLNGVLALALGVSSFFLYRLRKSYHETLKRLTLSSIHGGKVTATAEESGRQVAVTHAKSSFKINKVPVEFEASGHPQLIGSLEAALEKALTDFIQVEAEIRATG